ncbi:MULTISPECIES: glycosyltransferase [unclassified Streptomyces]|uniref:glycosyltransferase n=1 Tax=unclassified Streptomyces TaxID=2593676 RepID=UPI00278C6D44|nr:MULTISPECIES: glycosyltransferase [unclassified Streptomyces]
MTTGMSFTGSVAVTLAAAHTGATVLVGRRTSRRAARVVGEWALVLALAGAAATVAHGRVLSGEVLLLVALVPVLWLAARPLTGALRPAGRIAVPVSVAAHLALLAWCASAVTTREGAWAARVALTVWLVAGVPRMLLLLLDTYLNQERLLRDTWRAPHEPPARERFTGPFVSVQVPCHAEPPEVVVATLDALAAQRYADYEVLVVDNNTADPALWQPVREHCARLGERFRFHHVEGLAGAKAGALNYAMEHASSQARVVAVLDADYQARPDFLSRLVPLFDDPGTGFVQTRHDYRDWRNSPYLSGCYWEYRQMYGTYLVARAERGAAIVAGTMCLIRASALREVGGWAQWCSSEDSELSLRLHAAGYRSHYFDEGFGHGLVPETFGGYRRQRARWVFGPAQELRRHWRLILPGRWAPTSRMTGWHKLLHAHHGAREMTRAACTAVGMGCAAVLGGVLMAGGEVPWDPALPAVAVLLALDGLALRWCLLRRVLGAPARQAARAVWAQTALHHITWAAVLPSWWTMHRPWRRTDKFPALPKGLAALWPVWPEVALGALWAIAATATGVLAPAGPATFGVCVLLGWYACLAWSAPLLAIRADRALSAAAQSAPSLPVARNCSKSRASTQH